MFDPKCPNYSFPDESSSSQGHYVHPSYPPPVISSSRSERFFSCNPFESAGGDSVMGQDEVRHEFAASLLYNLSVLQHKVQEIRSLIGLYLSPNDHQYPNQNQLEQQSPLVAANMSSLVQEIIVTASSMMLTCQKISFSSCANEGHDAKVFQPAELVSQSQFEVGDQFVGNQERSGVSYVTKSDHDQNLDWYDESKCSTDRNRNVHEDHTDMSQSKTRLILEGKKNYVNIVELDAADLLAKYTHYCQVCGKGFKRDANLRMHMRAHGDEYKTASALANPVKQSPPPEPQKVRYSCPQEGCKWNQRHAKFQPLKSIICVKNHYKRSHCPKMYVCKRCNSKQFSVLSDLRTHEKHCGDLRWMCSCGTVFSRKDKLMGHVALFVGHKPVVAGLPPSRNY